ncbi:MAG TPA: TRAP transporter small permease [Herbaspirillum sp.]|jgi:TRAP-type C4-dicarboxylate transport system permease small subunit
MSGGADLDFHAPPTDVAGVPANAAVAILARLLGLFNKAMLALSMLAMVFTALILTYSVVVRYFLRQPTDWQDEISVFMLVGVIFLCAAYVQSVRGHIGIDAVASILPPAANKIRLFLVDLLSFAFCLFFAWKSWTLFYEALSEGQTTSSMLAPPMWIPYSIMALGMSMLTVQLLLQILIRIVGTKAGTDAGSGAREAA